jgi:RHS repeat-associated protein
MAANPGTYYPTFDGNGNVSEYLASDGTVKAHFEYDPFGNLTSQSYTGGFSATSFAHKFSTKYHDAETGLRYYGFRYYDPGTGRWTSRDPIGERGGVNLYGFVANDGVDQFDVVGLTDLDGGVSVGLLGDIDVKAKNNALKKLAKAKAGKLGGVIAQSANWPDFITGLQGIAAKISIEHLPHALRWALDVEAYYNPLTATANYQVNASSKIVVHELVHAAVDLRGIKVSRRQDEGMAYASEAVRGFIFREQGYYDILRKTEKDGETYRELVKRVWRGYWASNREESWADVEWPGGKKRLANSDIELLRSNFGVDFSCRKAAKIFNRLPKMAANCVFVTCGEGDVDFWGFLFVSPGSPVPNSIR